MVSTRNSFIWTAIIFVIFMLSGGCEYKGSTTREAPKKAIFSLMDRQQQAWNQGDIDKFMEGYLQSDSLRFASGDTVHYGWETLRDRYKRSYPNRETMGELVFSDRELDLLGSNHALLFGRWQLFRTTDTLSGRYTLIFQKQNNHWKIIHDHTSSR